MISVIPSVESIHNTIEALGTSWAGNSIGFIGMVTAVRERIEGIKTSGAVTVTLVLSLIAGAFAFAGMFYMAQGTRDDTRLQLGRMEKVQDDAKKEINVQLAAIMENATANAAIMADAFKVQMELSHKLFTSELEKRDIKLDIAFESAGEGSRYTGEQADDHEDMDNARYWEMREKQKEQEHSCRETREKVELLESMCTDTRGRITAIEAEHKGIGYHNGGSE